MIEKLAGLRSNIETVETCDHLRVNVREIVEHWTRRKGKRRIAGQCQDCFRRVERDDYPLQMKQPRWKAAQ
jgi:hypothetical protein